MVRRVQRSSRHFQAPATATSTVARSRKACMAWAAELEVRFWQQQKTSHYRFLKLSFFQAISVWSEVWDSVAGGERLLWTLQVHLLELLLLDRTPLAWPYVVCILKAEFYWGTFVYSKKTFFLLQGAAAGSAILSFGNQPTSAPAATTAAPAASTAAPTKKPCSKRRRRSVL